MMKIEEILGVSQPELNLAKNAAAEDETGSFGMTNIIEFEFVLFSITKFI